MTAEVDHLAEAARILRDVSQGAYPDQPRSTSVSDQWQALARAQTHALLAQAEILHEIAHQMRAPKPDPVVYCSAYLTSVNGEHRTQVPCRLEDGHDGEHHFTARGRR